MGRFKDILIDRDCYSMSYFLIVDLIKNSDEVIYTLRDLLNDKTYVVTEINQDKRVSYWLKDILKENGVFYRDPTYKLIEKYHKHSLYFHAWIKVDPQTIDDVSLIKIDAAKTFLEYEQLKIETLKLKQLESINKKLNNIDKSIVDCIGDDY